MTSNAIPTRSEDGLAALDIFYAGFNEVNFYFEDEDQENLYELICSKILSGFKISRVFPLGGKNNVLKHAQDPANDNLKQKRVYLLDKDFDDILGRIIYSPNIFYLDKYCIENFLFDDAALVEVVVQTYPKAKRDEVADLLRLDQYVPSLNAALDSLFRLFFCVQKLDLGLRNCKLKPEAFTVQNQAWEIDASKVAAYRYSVVKAAVEQGKLLSAEALDELARGAFPIGCGIDVNISGKFFGSILLHYVKNKYAMPNITFESFIYRVAGAGDLRQLQAVGRRISDYVRPPAAAVRA